jgi:hypothetical protein
MLSRNRFWWYRSLYDDYCSREIRLTFGIASLLWLPHYWLYFKNKKVGNSLEQRNRSQLFSQKLSNGIRTKEKQIDSQSSF